MVGVGEGLGEAVTTTEGDGDGEGEAVTDGLGLGSADGEAEAEADGLGVGDAEAEAVGEGLASTRRGSAVAVGVVELLLTVTPGRLQALERVAASVKPVR